MDGIIAIALIFFFKYMITGLHAVKQLPVESMCLYKYTEQICWRTAVQLMMTQQQF